MEEFQSRQEHADAHQILVAIPCLNEETTIASVVASFRQALPEAVVAVFDNGSTDRSAELAAAAGAEVHRVETPGKGHVVRAILSRSHDEVVVIVDGTRRARAGALPFAPRTRASNASRNRFLRAGARER
jgi:cellulose synthase/poly-beta-1,6-N-acetylglucosamine synthase-like glycosyltransferase